MSTPPEIKSKILEFNITNIFGVLSTKYKHITPGDRAVVNTCIAMLVTMAAVVLYISWRHHEIAELPLVKATEVLILSLWVSITFFVLDRMEVVTPAEARLNETTIRLQDNEDRLRGAIETAAHELRSSSEKIQGNMLDTLAPIAKELVDGNQQLRDYLTSMAGFDAYADAQDQFGFVGLLMRDNGSSDIFYEYTRGLRGKQILIRYMNTFIRDVGIFRDAVRDLVRNGVDIDILVMHPDENAAVVEARRVDAFAHYPPPKYVGLMKHTAEELLFLRKQMDAERLENESFGVLRVCFYRKSLNFPLIIIEDRAAQKREWQIFTGFYGRISAEVMPFLHWRGAQERPLKAFKDLFDKKFDDCFKGGLSEIKTYVSDIRSGVRSSGISAFDRQLQDACDAFELSESRHHAVELLWGAWRYLVVHHHPTEQRSYIQYYLERASSIGSLLRDILQSEINSLVELERKWNLQHHTGPLFSQHNGRDAEYLFRRLLALLQILLSEPTDGSTYDPEPGR